MTTSIEVKQPINQTQTDESLYESGESTFETTNRTNDALPSEQRSLLSLEFDHQTRQDYYQVCGRW
jgi:hypothetical protein